MRITLLRNWRYYLSGETVDLKNVVANDLIRTGFAVLSSHCPQDASHSLIKVSAQPTPKKTKGAVKRKIGRPPKKVRK